jgi:hypothetical protein
VIALSPVEQSANPEFRLGSKPDRENPIHVSSKPVSFQQCDCHFLIRMSIGAPRAIFKTFLRILQTVQRTYHDRFTKHRYRHRIPGRKSGSMAVKGLTAAEIEQEIREACNTIYTTVILPDLNPLVPIGLVDAAQAKRRVHPGHSIHYFQWKTDCPLL